MARWLLILLVLLTSCSPGGGDEGAGPETESLSAGVLIEFGRYTFVPTEATAERNLREYIEGATPNGIELIDISVRSIEVDGGTLPGEIVAAAYDRGELSAEVFYLKILKQVAPVGAREILGGKGVLVESEGTSVVATFPTEDTLLYLVGPEASALETIAAGLLRENGS